MTTRDAKMTWAWAAIAICIAVAVSYVFAGQAHANAPTLHETIVAAVPSLGSKKEPTVDADELADAVTAVTHDRQWAALMLAVMANESALSARIARGEYRDREADSYRAKDGSIHHKAWGLGQLHSNKLNETAWGSKDVAVQVAETHKALRRGFYGCGASRDGKLRSDWVARSVNGFAGHSCDAVWPGLKTRLATFERLRGRL